MPRILKYLAFGLGGLLALLLIAVAIIAATFDPNAYKPQIIKLVQEKKQRTLAIPGDIKLTFFPKIGADLGKLSISEHKSPTVFASVESARISLALLPLLRKEVVVDKIKIDGLTANLKRYKDGKTNIDDLLSKEKEEEPSQAVKLDIDGVSITNTNVFFDDQMAGRKLELTKVNLSTGKIANGAPSDFKLTADVRSNDPQLATQIDIKSGFTLNLEQAHYVLKGLDAQVKGQAAGFSDLAVKLEGDVDLKPNAKQITLDDLKLSANGKQGPTTMEAKFAVPTLAVTDQKVKAGKIAGQAKLSDAGKTIDANFSVPSFDGTPQAFTIPSLGLDAVIKQGELNATAKLTGAINGDLDKQIFTSREIRLDLDGKKGPTAIKGVLTTPFTANMNAQVIELAKIVADFALPNPAGGAMAFKAGGNLNANLAKQTLAAHLNGKLDQSTIDAKFGLAKFTPPAYNFDVSIDQIDVDRYTEKKPEGSGATGKPAQATPAAEQPIDLSALKDLNANGSVKIGSLKAANIRASNVRIDIRAAGGKLEVSPLNANLYQGSLAGAVTVAATNPPRFAVRQNLTGVSIGPLLKDAIGKEPIEGRGSIQLDVTTQGALVSAMKRALDGTAKFDLRDGAVSGVNIAKAIRTAKVKLGGASEGQQAGTSSTEEKTDFSELTGSFRINNGVAHNDDLSAKSPLLRVGGQGDINLVSETLDYTVKATVVSTLQGQGGPELQAMKGLTVPVRLSGPFTAIAWKVDLAGLATQVVKQKIDERKDEVKAKAVEKLQDRLKGLFGK